jgi:DNA-binding response OmpR family regulator
MGKEPGYLLIVEDDPDILRLLKTALTFRGHRVVTSRNGREGLDTVQKEKPALVIADIMMPKLDGFGLVHRLRIEPDTRGIPVIFITATYVAREDREFALNIGVTRFIQKPVDMESFLETIDELLEQGEREAMEPIKEYSFYEGYRTRLQSKLDEKARQILRDDRLLESDSYEEDSTLLASRRHAVAERDELKLLLEQVRKHLEKLEKPD